MTAATAALGLVRHYAGKMQIALEEQRLPEAMRQASDLFAQLRTRDLSPREYYELFTSVFDESRGLASSLFSLGAAVSGWYEKAQYGMSALPRLYLMITVGEACAKVGCRSSVDTVFDLLEMSKAIQNPLRGLFLRYYLNKSLKDLSSSLSTTDSIRFFLDNLYEMHRLWSRLPVSVTDSQERNELCVLLGENITRISQLPGVSLSLYQESVLPRLLAIVATARDDISQGYLIDGVVHTFPDEFHVYTLATFLSSVEKLAKADKLKLAELLTDRLMRYAEAEEGRKTVIATNADIVLKTFVETAALSTDVTETQALYAAEKLIVMLDRTRSQDFRLESEVLVTIGTKMTMSGSEAAGPVESRLLSILSFILQRGNFQAMEMTSFRILMTYLAVETRAEVSLKALEMMLGSGASLRSDDIPTFLSFATSIVAHFRTDDDSTARQSALERVCKLLHFFSLSVTDASRIVAKLYPSLCVHKDAARIISPTLLFTLCRSSTPESGLEDCLQWVECLLETVENCDAEIGLRLALFVCVARVEVAERVMTRSVQVWRSRTSELPSLDSVLLLLATLHSLSTSGLPLTAELSIALQSIHSLPSHSDRCRALCCYLSTTPTDPYWPVTLKTAVRVADLSGAFELISVLNACLTIPGVTISLVKGLIALINTYKCGRRELRYFAETMELVRAAEQRRDSL